MRTLKIFQTSDIHGNIYPTNYVEHRNQGLAKISQIIKERSKLADYHLTFDTGDVLQGSSLAFYCEKKQVFNPSIIEAFNLINYDGISLGNHEFNYGLKYLSTHYQKFNGPILCANIANLPFTTKPYQIYEVDNLKIAVIGLTTDFIPHWENPENIKGLVFNNPVETYQQYEAEMKSKSDMIIVNYHGGFELDCETAEIPTENQTGENIASKLINTFDSIDIMLTGHQHRLISCQTKGVTCSQPGPYGQNVTEITIDIDQKKVIEHHLISCADYEADQVILDYFDKLNENCNEYLDTTLTKLDQDLTITDVSSARLNSHPLLSFIAHAFNDYISADVIALSLFDSAIGFTKDVTIRQVNQNYPFPNTIVKIKVKGEQIMHALTQSNDYYTLDDANEISINRRFIEPKLKHYNYDMFWGVSYDVLVNHGKNEITNVKIQGKDLVLEQDYTMLVSNYRYNDIADYPVFKNVKKIFESQDDAIEILLSYLSKHESINVINDMDYRIINNYKQTKK